MTSDKSSSYSDMATRNSKPLQIGEGVLYPLAWLSILHDCKSIAELKVIGCIWGYDAIVGVEAEPLAFMDLVQRTGLTKKSLSQALKRVIEGGLCIPHEVNGTRYFLPREASKPHVHDHVSFKHAMVYTSTDQHEHEHGEEGKPRAKINQVLLDEFGMTKSPRVAADICLSPKYPLARLVNQLRYTRWEVKRGLDSNSARPIKNPAGRFIYRLRHNEPAPREFNLVKALIDDEGWSQNELFTEIFFGRVELPEILESLPYHAWLTTGEGRELPF